MQAPVDATVSLVTCRDEIDDSLVVDFTHAQKIYLELSTSIFLRGPEAINTKQDGKLRSIAGRWNFYLEGENYALTFRKSEAEENNSVEAVEEVEVEASATAGGPMSVLDALKGVLKLALMHDGLGMFTFPRHDQEPPANIETARGLREASKALDRRQAHVCILNEAWFVHPSSFSQKTNGLENYFQRALETCPRSLDSVITIKM